MAIFVEKDLHFAKSVSIVDSIDNSTLIYPTLSKLKSDPVFLVSFHHLAGKWRVLA